jgi:hypothetical protein
VTDVDFFEQAYMQIHNTYSSLYPGETLCGLNLQRVDSSPVAEMSNKLREGLICGNEY